MWWYRCLITGSEYQLSVLFHFSSFKRVITKLSMFTLFLLPPHLFCIAKPLIPFSDNCSTMKLPHRILFEAGKTSYSSTSLLGYMQMTLKLLPGMLWHPQGDGSFPRSCFCWLAASAPFSSGSILYLISLQSSDLLYNRCIILSAVFS